MALIFILLLTLTTPHELRGELQETPELYADSLNRKGHSSGLSITGKELVLPDVIASVNIDYINNALVVQFRRPGQLARGDKSEDMDNSFMRFGRGAEDSSLMRFGKRQLEVFEANPEIQEGTNENSARDSRGDNFMRFGRSNGNLMRFGRAAARGDSSENKITYSLVHSPQSGELDKNTIKSGHEPDESLIGFVRRDPDFTRFTRSNGQMRFGRSDSFMRLGRTHMPEKLVDTQLNVAPYVPRLNRNDKNFMRFGKLDQNFMRFGKRQKYFENQDTKHTKSIMNYLENWPKHSTHQ